MCPNGTKTELNESKERMIFNEHELAPGIVKVTPRLCHGGELLAMWITAYGKTAATHLWDIGVARAFSNVGEIEKAIAATMESRNINRIEAQKYLILQSGLYKRKDTTLSETTITISKAVAEQITNAADREGISVDEYLQRIQP